MRLKDAEWIIPLLQAHLEGKTIQVRNVDGAWNDIPSHYNLPFSLTKEYYRIKPKTIKTKRFLWAWPPSTTHVLVVDSESNAKEPREKADGFIRWVDTEWQEIEV